MRPPLIHRPGRSAPRRTRERGVTMALVAVAIVSILAMAALSIDVGTLYEASADAQKAADAGALAAARTISMQGLTGDPGNSALSWQAVCGGESSPASVAAQTVAQQIVIGGAVASTIKVSYGTSAGIGNEDCSSAGAAFGVNPVVQVYVQQVKLPTFFSRIFGLLPGGTSSSSGVSATATAEVFNSSNSGAYSSSNDVVPVQPRCVKPWMVPNLEPWSPAGCTNNSSNLCTPFVDNGSGAIGNPGMQSNNPANVIGQRFWLLPDCTGPGSPNRCNFRSTPPQANFGGDRQYTHLTPNLEYLPGLVSSDSIAVPSDGTDACNASASPAKYAEAIAGCDQTTVYHCGQASLTQQAAVDLTENPTRPANNSDTTNGVQCLTHQGAAGIGGLSGQDALLPIGGPPPYYPFQIQPGTSNPLITAGLLTGSPVVTSSTSIVSLPIYDTNNTITQAGPDNVTIVGFLQVFINAADTFGNVYVTVVNVSGCGNGVVSPPLVMNGTSPVPVRLITLPPPSN